MEMRPSTALKTQAIHLGRGLSIYKQPLAPGRGSPNWYARATVDLDGRRVHIKSTKTSDRLEAMRRAEEFKADLMIQQRSGVPVVEGCFADRSYRFDVVADCWLSSLERGHGSDRRRLQRFKDHRKILLAHNGACAFFKKTDIRTITSDDVEAYLAFAEETSAKGSLQPSTKRNVLNSLRGVLRYALNNGLTARIPDFPTVRMRDNPRPSFSAQEYGCLSRMCLSFARRAEWEERPVEVRRWSEMRDFIPFMVGSFLRPSEWPYLQHKHVRIVEDGGLSYLELTITHGKTGQRVAVTMPNAVRAYKRITQRNGSDSNSYVFLPEYPNRETAKERMRDRFEFLLDQTGMTFDAFDNKRVLYSLRHTSLTLRLLYGDKVDLLTLAKNAGTSVEMLERFYCSSLDPRSKVRQLQSMRG
jgi:hypothetical protein